MRDDPDGMPGPTDGKSTNTQQPTPAGDRDTRGVENTRRTFLGGALGGALAGAIALGGAGSATAQVSDDQFSFECDHVRLSDAGGIDSLRVDFEDGSYVTSANGVGLDGADAVRYGSPGRTVTSVTFNGDRTVSNADPCQHRRRATTFTATTVHVPTAEFMLSGSDAPPSVPSVLNTRVQLHFVDGTSETVQDYSGDGSGSADDFPELSGIEDRYGMDAVPNCYRGTGANAGKVIEAIEIQTDLDYRDHYLRSDVAEATTLGAQTAQERAIEIVGTSQGAVEYELTATGPIRRLRINDRIGAADNDAISQNDDGTWTASGFTGNTGYGDAYVVNGEITEHTQTGGDGDYVVRAMERHVIGGSGSSGSGGGATSDGDTSHEVAVIATEQGEATYEFTVDGTVEPASDVAADLVAEDNDAIRDNGDGTVTVSGYTGNTGYGDTYTVTGDLLSFERTGGQAAFRIELDGSSVSSDELVDSYEKL